jgi:hypothetical protein
VPLGYDQLEQRGINRRKLVDQFGQHRLLLELYRVNKGLQVDLTH